MGDSVIVAVIMIGMIIAGLLGALVATRKGNSGFISAVKLKGKNDHEEKRR